MLARLQSEARGLTVAEAREASIGIMQDCLSVYGDKAQALSAEMFDEICEAEGIDADPGEMFDDVIDSSRLAGKVHYYAGKLVDGDWDGYAGSNADLAAYYVHRSALENMERNCHKNGVRYARVGTGRETCGYCFMLSSRGFDYRSEKTASAGSHEHCDCIIVPGVDGVTKIDGYDPAAMRNRWESCYDTIGGRKQLSAEWDSLSKKDKSKHKESQRPNGAMTTSGSAYRRSARRAAQDGCTVVSQLPSLKKQVQSRTIGNSTPRAYSQIGE